MPKDKSQIEKFKQTAHEIEADESEERFDERLKRVVKAPPASPKNDKRD